MLGGRNSIGGRGVDDKAAMFRGGRQVDIVDPDAGASHHLEPASGGLEHVAANGGAAPDDQGVAEGDLGAELLGAEVVGAVDVGEALEQLKTCFSELLGYQDGRLGVQYGCHYQRPFGLGKTAGRD